LALIHAGRVVIGAALAIVVPLGGTAGATPAAWHEVNSGRGPSRLSAMSCNRSGGCVAYGIDATGVNAQGVELFRSENGKTWRSMPGPNLPQEGLSASPSEQDAASCGSGDFCMVEIPNSKCVTRSGVSCGNATFAVTRNDGESWQSADGFGRSPHDVTNLTCPGDGVCVWASTSIMAS
jgi:hypothetical protein